ncbi:MAG: beta-lactamase family protein [Propionibacteriaceae bacterium]|jgi:CubicO group peptidase (beta-lactamase class C family)|nr:beta-lactamase family protein [Propionibacteriaceae bacterium]
MAGLDLTHPVDPAEVGVDPAGVVELVEALETEAAVEPHALVILRHGRVIARGGWRPHSPDRAGLVYSLSKSFTSTALGLAVDAGLVGLDEPFIAFFPEVDGPEVSERTRRLKVRHLAAMATGHAVDMWPVLRGTPAGDLFRVFARMEPEAEPGSLFAYNQLATYSIAEIIRRRSGQRLLDYLRPRLLEPMGLRLAGWQQFQPGLDLGFSGLFASADAVAALGQLYLRRGLWQGRRLLSEAWVDQATRFQVDNSTRPGQEDPDWRQGYGFQFWISRHGYRGDGAFGQYCLVLPDQDMVVALTSQTLAMQSVLDLIWDNLLPAVGRRGTPQAEDPLADRQVELPDLGGDGTGDIVFSADSVNFQVAGGREVDLTPPLVSAVELRLAGGVGTVRLGDGQSELRLAARRGAWTTTEAGPDSPITVAVGWDRDDQSVRVDLLFLETPHHAVLTCDLQTGACSIDWQTPPLVGCGLRDLGRP